MPFSRAIKQDEFYKYVVLDNAEYFWKKLKLSGVNIDACSEECRQLIFSMIGWKPELRPSLNEILASPIFTKSIRISSEDAKKEFINRRNYMDLIREKEQELAKKNQEMISAEEQDKIRKSHRGHFDADQLASRQLYPFFDTVKNKF